MTREVDHSVFQLEIPLEKAWRDEQGELWFEGVASSTAVDRQRERMSLAAMQKMSQCKGLDLLPSHDAPPLTELGTVEECWVDNEQFRVMGRLDPSKEEALRLYERLRAGKRYGLSVGGKVLAAHWECDPVSGERVRVIDEAMLEHIALCRPGQAVNQDTYLQALAKAAEGLSSAGGGLAGGADAGGQAGATCESEGLAAGGGFGSERSDARLCESEHEARSGARLARVGRFVVDLLKSLRAVATGREGSPPGEEGLELPEWGLVASELAELRGELRSLRLDLSRLAKGAASRGQPLGAGEVGTAEGGDGPQAQRDEPKRTKPAGGGRQSLDGQGYTGTTRTNIWKGVL